MFIDPIDGKNLAYNYATLKKIGRYTMSTRFEYGTIFFTVCLCRRCITTMRLYIFIT